MKQNHLLKNILLTTSICALLTTSGMAMEQDNTSQPPSKKRKAQREPEHTPLQQQPDNPPQKKPKNTLSSENPSSNQSDLIINEPQQQNNQQQQKNNDRSPIETTPPHPFDLIINEPPHQNNQQQNPNPSVPMEDGKNHLNSLPKNLIGMIATHLDKKDVANMREVSKKNKGAIDSTGNSFFVQGYDEKSGVKNPNALFKAARMGHVEARQILTRAADIYKQLRTENDPNKQLSLCMNLAKDGLFLLLSGGYEQDFIRGLSNLAEKNIEGARAVFLELSNDMAKMTKGGQEHFIVWLSYLA